MGHGGKERCPGPVAVLGLCKGIGQLFTDIMFPGGFMEHSQILAVIRRNQMDLYPSPYLVGTSTHQALPGNLFFQHSFQETVPGSVLFRHSARVKYQLRLFPHLLGSNTQKSGQVLRHQLHLSNGRRIKQESEIYI